VGSAEAAAQKEISKRIEEGFGESSRKEIIAAPGFP
jgi:hypothetical protein